MPVMTINTDDFLVQKNSGDVVTGADWNKLVALFHAVNDNANQLLNTMKAVDVNTANIAQVTQGAVPDGSIEYSKLSKIGGTTKKYILTTDITPKPGTVYYTLENHAYVPHPDLAIFETGTQYYTLETVATTAAIADCDVIGDGVIKNYNIAEGTLLPNVCSELLLGGLLNDNATVYTDRSISGKFPAGTTPAPTAEHTIKLDKQHKALLIINTGSIVLLTADENKPNIFIGAAASNTNSSSSTALSRLVYSGGFYIKQLIGENKRMAAPQSAWTPSAFSWNGVDTEFGNYPAKLLSADLECKAQLTQCFYDYATQSIIIKVQHLQTDRDEYDATDYQFGDLIIGL